MLVDTGGDITNSLAPAPIQATRHGVKSVGVPRWHSDRSGHRLAAALAAHSRPARLGPAAPPPAGSGHWLADARKAWQARGLHHVVPQVEGAPSLSAQLHALEGAIQTFSQSLSHPAEFREHAEFKQAVQLLRSPDVPLQTVMQYAVGVNWALNCVALAALEERPDRGQAAPEVVAHFDKLAPFAMYFALRLFLVADPRPPAGAPAAGAREWWTENPVIPVIFREYFAGARAPRRCAGVRPVHRQRARCHAAGGAQLPVAPRPALCRPAARRAAGPAAARQHRPRVPDLLRPLLGRQIRPRHSHRSETRGATGSWRRASLPCARCS